ncbi:hypothetical protein [Desmospora profundinema]|uniref:Uncharacterized protein n=1 Tax=Desmospora profundinema TaxID=1571184 RepID=A0ABU1IKI6_9BACL|nr:hypothetical protein [Desmospora profundinema]MDR6225297.1 hypothetical protein [Desmospora profundinema]
MLSVPDEYRLFARLVKRVIVMDVLYRALLCDIRWMESQPFKLKRGILDGLVRLSIQVEEEWRETKQQLRRCGGEIVEVKQKRDCREVRARFRGFIHTQRFFNEWIRAECEKQLIQIWTGKNTSQTLSFFRPS